LKRNEHFGTGPSVFEQIVAEIAPDAASSDHVLLDLARADLGRAIDCLWSAAAFIPAETVENMATPLASLGRIAVEYTRACAVPAWVGDSNLNNDDQFIDRLLSDVTAWKNRETKVTDPTESFGLSDVWNHLKAAAIRLSGAAASYAEAR